MKLRKYAIYLALIAITVACSSLKRTAQESEKERENNGRVK